MVNSRKKMHHIMQDIKLKKYDLHMHSYYSDCSRNKPKDILKMAKAVGLNGIAITDHHTLKAYPILKKLNIDKNFEIIPGEEITTQYGDVIALYIKSEIKTRDFLQVVKEVKSQGGLIVIPHPFRNMPGITAKFPLEKFKDKIDAIEVFNSRTLTSANFKAKVMAEKLGLAQTGSSDGHILVDIGKGYTLFKGDLKKAILSRKTRAEGTNKYGLWSVFNAALNKRILLPFGLKYKPKGHT